MSSRAQIEEKVLQVLYGGKEHYDAAEVFESDEQTVAARMFNDYIDRGGSDIVAQRSKDALKQMGKDE